MHTKYWWTWSTALLLSFAAALARAEIVDISGDQLMALVKQGTPVVDVRTAGEWRQTGVLKGSRLITLFDEQGRADPADWARQVDKVVAADKPLILICRSGSRSGKAAHILDKAGHKGIIYNVKGGISGWMREGQPVVSVQENLKQAGITCTPSC